MNAYQIKRLLGYALWAIGLLVFLPPALLEPEGPVSLYHFLLFNALVVCLFGGFLLVDSANTALKRLEEHQPIDHADFLGMAASRRHADKHYHPPAPVPAALEDDQPDDMPAARSLVAVVLGLLAVCVVLALVIHNQQTPSTPTINALQEQR
jgi:Zn-dependent protease with chaperone function